MSLEGGKGRGMLEGPTGDSSHLSRPATGQLTTYQEVVESPPALSFADPSFAIDCSDPSVSSVGVYVEAGIAPATRRAYRADLDHFEAWGGTVPATDDMVAAYIAAHATALKVSTLTRRLAAISIAHGARSSQTRWAVHWSGRRCVASDALTGPAPPSQVG